MLPLNPYPNSVGLELDLRQELNQTLTGGSLEVPKGQILVLRIMRRANGVTWTPTLESELQKCDCTTDTNEEFDKTYPCEKCKGEGYLNDDVFAAGYSEEQFSTIDVENRRPYSKATISMTFFYIEYYQDLSRFDKIIEPQTDIDGTVLTPLRIYRRFDIQMAQKMRSDNGRVEYWRCAANSDP